jgi:hypothetical protein
VAFEPALGWAALHTHTEELSAAGAVISSDYGNLTGAKVTLILELPPGVDEQITMLRVPARVTSSEPMPQQGRYRHDVVFVRSPNDRLSVLDKYFGDQPAPPAPAAPQLSHLDKLKALAQQKLAEEKAKQKLAEEKAQQRADSADDLIDKALRQTYEYFKELVAQLNVVKPEFPTQYAIAGVPEFRGLSWSKGHADCFYAREIASKHKPLDRVCLNFELSGGEPIQLSREYPASERLKRLLNDSKIEFTASDVYSARGSLESVKFEVPRALDAGVQLTAKYDLGKIQLNTTHIAGFGIMQWMVAPEAISEASLNEFSGFILGEVRVLKLLLRQGT